ncbi:MAG: hypothetical protein KF746_02190 [Chitinophagaceae bacterium]|nr:hypothetical protein [Chitinophagaceae bacterium]
MNQSEFTFLWGLFAIIFVVVLIPAFLFLLTLYRTLDAVDPASRTMPPGQIWLLLIPVFSSIWIFIVVIRIADSIKNEYARLNIPLPEPRPAYSVGLAMAILALCGIIPLLGTLASLGSIVCWIVYWVKVNSYKNLIIANRDNFLLDAEREAVTPVAH